MLMSHEEWSHFWPKPWRFEESGYLDGPCVKDAGGSVICTFFWPGHPVEETERAEKATYSLGERTAALGDQMAPRGQFRGKSTPNALDDALNELERIVGKLRTLHAAAREIIQMRFDTYRAGNNRQVGIQGDDGEKCWIVHSDQMTALEAALAEAEADNVIFAPIQEVP
jgi:hypothetical protein